jgi:hypothetical protein
MSLCSVVRLNVVMLNVVKLIVIMLSIVRLNVVMLSVVAPKLGGKVKGSRLLSECAMKKNLRSKL